MLRPPQRRQPQGPLARPLITALCGVLLAIGANLLGVAFASSATAAAPLELVSQHVPLVKADSLTETMLVSATGDSATVETVASHLPTPEATRPDGTIGRIIIGVLLLAVLALWITMIAVVVRVNSSMMRQRRTPNPIE